MPASAHAEIEFLKAALEGKAVTLPVKLFVALCEEEPTRDATSETIKETGKGKELAYTGYKRVEIKVEAASWDFTEGTSGAISKALNHAEIAMEKNTGANEKNKAKSFALVDKAKNTEAGNVWFYGKLTEELEIVKALTSVSFAAKALAIEAE